MACCARGGLGLQAEPAVSGNCQRGTELAADFITIKQVCDLLKIAERTAYDLCRAGKLPGAAKVGNQWRVNRLKLMDWLEAGGDFEREAGEAAKK